MLKFYSAAAFLSSFGEAWYNLSSEVFGFLTASKGNDYLDFLLLETIRSYEPYIKYTLPILSALLLLRCLFSMLSHKSEPEVWAMIVGTNGDKFPVLHWECIIGKSRGADISVDDPKAASLHATLIRQPNGKWYISTLKRRYKLLLNKEEVGSGKTELVTGDTFTIGRRSYKFKALSPKGRAKVEASRLPAGYAIGPAFSLFILSLFELLLAFSLCFRMDEKYFYEILFSFSLLVLVEWLLYFLMRIMGRSGFEPELLAFFLSSIGLGVVVSSRPEETFVALLTIMGGVLLFILLGLWLRDFRRVRLMQFPLAVFAVSLLAFCAVFGTSIFGAKNWIVIGSFSIQPSEFVKVAYIFAGAAAMDRLFLKRELYVFIIFSAICVILLTLMGDFGTAFVFFSTFLIIAFMRSGSFATVALSIAGAAFASFLAFTLRPYIAERFDTWGHVWENVWDKGFQQAKAMSAVATGGLFGKGAGAGSLKSIFAANTDLVFAMVSEELGFIVALCAFLAIVSLGFFTVKNARQGRGAYFTIAGCGAAGMMLVQTALNVFGSLDLLPFTGVTFPFVSKGGSSLVSCFMLLAFIKASDTRRDASFIVKPLVSNRELREEE